MAVAVEAGCHSTVSGYHGWRTWKDYYPGATVEFKSCMHCGLLEYRVWIESKDQWTPWRKAL